MCMLCAQHRRASDTNSECIFLRTNFSRERDNHDPKSCSPSSKSASLEPLQYQRRRSRSFPLEIAVASVGMLDTREKRRSRRGYVPHGSSDRSKQVTDMEYLFGYRPWQWNFGSVDFHCEDSGGIAMERREMGRKDSAVGMKGADCDTATAIFLHRRSVGLPRIPTRLIALVRPAPAQTGEPSKLGVPGSTESRSAFRRAGAAV